MELKGLVNELNKMILEGKIMDAFEKFYAKDVVMEDKTIGVVKGKTANRERELAFVNGLTAFRGAEVKAVAVGDNTTMVEWFMDYTHKDWGDKKYT